MAERHLYPTKCGSHLLEKDVRLVCRSDGPDGSKKVNDEKCQLSTAAHNILAAVIIIIIILT